MPNCYSDVDNEVFLFHKFTIFKVLGCTTIYQHLTWIDIWWCGMIANAYSPSKSQFIKVNHYRSKYGLQHGALAHT